MCMSAHALACCVRATSLTPFPRNKLSLRHGSDRTAEKCAPVKPGIAFPPPSASGCCVVETD